MSSRGGGTKHCVVAYAARERQYLWPVVLPQEASVGDALAAARAMADSRAASGIDSEPPQVPWEEAAVGIFGEPCERGAIPADGDRIELYRPLVHDPKQARRERARRRA